MIWHVKKEGENRDETGLCQRGHDSLICGRLLPFSPRMLSPSPWIISITPFLWRLPAAPSICSAPGWETVLSLALPRLYFTRFVPGVKFQMWKSKATTLKLQKQQQNLMPHQNFLQKKIHLPSQFHEASKQSWFVLTTVCFRELLAKTITIRFL